MSENKKGLELPPTPRGQGNSMNTELIPFRSSKISLKKSPILMVIVGVAVLTLMMWGTLNTFFETRRLDAIYAFTQVAIASILLCIFAFLYIYSKSDKPIWAFVFPMAITYLIMHTPLMQLFFWLFRDILPGKLDSLKGNPGFADAFIVHFFAAGLMEETLKVVSVILGAWLFLNASQWKSSLPEWIRTGLSVRNPLDGLLYAAAAGAMFIFVETGEQYSGGTILGSGGDAGKIIQGLLLIIPRTMGGVMGHMAYAGITGYFIGLAVLRPQMPKYYVLVALVVASVLHALWNASSYGLPAAKLVSVVATILLFVSCFLKARQLDAASGGGRDSFGSIVVDPRMLRPVDKRNSSSAGMGTPGSPVAAAAPLNPSAAAPTRLLLDIAGNRFDLISGQVVDLAGKLPTLSEAAMRVTSHPQHPNILGLRNEGNHAWQVTTPNGSTQSVDAQRNVRLVAGLRIEFMPGVIGAILEG